MEDEKNPDVIPQGKKAEKVSSGVSSSAHYGEIKKLHKGLYFF